MHHTAVAVTLLTEVVSAQIEHRELKRMGDESHASLHTNDERIPLQLTQAVQEAVRRIMREHLEALQAILAALAREEHEKAAAVAHEDLGFPKHHQAMMREEGATFPP